MERQIFTLFSSSLIALNMGIIPFKLNPACGHEENHPLFWLCLSLVPAALLFLIRWKHLPTTFALAFITLLGGFLTTFLVLVVGQFEFLNFHPYLIFVLLAYAALTLLFSICYNPKILSQTSLREKLLIASALTLGITFCLYVYNIFHADTPSYYCLGHNAKNIILFSLFLFCPCALACLTPWRNIPRVVAISFGLILCSLLIIQLLILYSLFLIYQDLLFGLFCYPSVLIPLIITTASASIVFQGINRKVITSFTQACTVIFIIAASTCVIAFNQLPLRIFSWDLRPLQDSAQRIQVLSNGYTLVPFKLPYYDYGTADYFYSIIQAKGSIRLRAQTLDDHFDFTLLYSSSNNELFTICDSEEEAKRLIQTLKFSSVYY